MSSNPEGKSISQQFEGVFTDFSISGIGNPRFEASCLEFNEINGN
jgi:hypothetical protein